MLPFLRLRGAAAAVLSGLLLFAACGGAEDAPGLTGFDGTGGSGGAKPGSPCDEGKVQSCSITLGRQGNVLSCYHGTQACENGVWQECSDGSLEEQSAPAWLSNPGLRQFALSDPVDCANNPCDPFCETYAEVPDQPLEPEEEDPKYEWEEGTLADFPGGLVNKGLQEPCETGFDCQFNMRCEGPAVGNCSHSVCEAGEELDSECNDCAAIVCDADYTCCTGFPNDVAACNHDPCALGEGLDDTCNNCVAQICNSNDPDLAACCDTQGNNDNWTQDCVDAVASVCGNTCECATGESTNNGSCYYYESTDYDWDDSLAECEDRGEGWNLVTINNSAENTYVAGLSTANKHIGFEEVSNKWYWASDHTLGNYNESNGVLTPSSFYKNWATSHPATASDPDCAYMGGSDGKWYGITACNSNTAAQKRDSVCEGPTSVMELGASVTYEWTSDCVALAESVCDVKCNDDDPAEDSGSCTPWYPGETDADCAGVDLSVGVPCDGKIPVCNHGNVTAKAPIELVHFPANSQQFPTCTPDMTHPNTVTCEVTQDIPPGECVTVDGDLCWLPDGDLEPLNGNREIMVNPGGDLIDTDEFGVIAECSCQDNWSLYSNSADTCGEPTCGGGSTSAAQVKVPVDIIIIVDNSPSMEDEIEEVQERLNDDLAAILAASDLDYRVIIVSRFGDVTIDEGTSAVNICIGEPLGANACTDASNETLVLNAPNFYHFSAEIESWDAWCQLLYGYNHTDEVGVTDQSASGLGTSRTWSALAPNGWQDWLRDDAFKHFVMITDDDADCTDYGYNFDDSPGCEPPANSTEFFQGKQHNCHTLSTQTVGTSDVTAGEETAEDFDAALLALSPEQFGTSAERNYMWHSIVNIRTNPSGVDLPWQPTDAMQTQMCTPANTGIVGAGTGYQALSRLTGGLRYSICQNNNFDAIFNAIAEEVLETSQASCEFELGDTSNVDVDAAAVSWTDSNDVSNALTQVGALEDCGGSTSAWYYDDPSDPSTLTLCPATCEDVQADSAAQVWLEFGCPRDPSETTISEVYQAECASDETPQWAFLFYDTTIPNGSDAQVTFEVRAARSEADLEYATFDLAATATASSQDCAKGAPVDDVCPVDLYSLLGNLDAKEEFLELQITLTPGSDNTTPTVANWEITYSCPPGE